MKKLYFETLFVVVHELLIDSSPQRLCVRFSSFGGNSAALHRL